MFVIFGWLKESTPVKPLLDTWCYHCNSQRTWELYCETEWVTFFDIRTFPFMKKYFLYCSKCHDTLPLDKHTGNTVMQLDSLGSSKSQMLHDNLVCELEKHQLSNKTERQLAYIRSIRDSNKN